MKILEKNLLRLLPEKRRSLTSVLYLMILLAFTTAHSTQAAKASAEPLFSPPVIMVIKKVHYNTKNAIATADGRVEIIQGNTVIEADSISYNLATGTVHANGHVSVVNALCSPPVYMNDTQLTNALAQGVIQQFHILLRHNKKFIAREAAARQSGVKPFKQASNTKTN